MFHRLRITCLLAALASATTLTTLRAQNGGQPGDLSTPSTAAPRTAADVAFEPLGKAFTNLQISLRNKGGVAAEDHPAIGALRDRAAVFSREFPADVRGPVMELALSKWLKDDEELIEGLYARIIHLDPENHMARSSWAQMHVSNNRYAEALEVLAPVPPDMLKESANATPYADALLAEHRFQEAIDAVSQLPEASLPSGPDGATTRVGSIINSAKTCLQHWPEELSIRQQEEAAGDLPRVLMVTSKGQITLELFENQAPNTVANFISLVDQGFYNSTRFHRVITNFMAQGGDPNSKPGATGVAGEGDPGYYISDEHERADHRKHFTGSLSMAKKPAANTGGCQFFMTVTPTPHLNGKHTVFGRVLEGLDVVRSLRENDEVELVTVTRRRPHEYKPATLPLSGVVVSPPPPPASDDEAPSPDPAIPPADEVPPASTPEDEQR